MLSPRPAVPAHRANEKQSTFRKNWSDVYVESQVGSEIGPNLSYEVEVLNAPRYIQKHVGCGACGMIRLGPRKAFLVQRLKCIDSLGPLGPSLAFQA